MTFSTATRPAWIAVVRSVQRRALMASNAERTRTAVADRATMALASRVLILFKTATNPMWIAAVFYATQKRAILEVLADPIAAPLGRCAQNYCVTTRLYPLVNTKWHFKG
jgi:hypothetical protein